MNQLAEERSSALVIDALGELIEALDRRVPQVARAGEIGIAKEASLLRDQAVTRIQELSRPSAA